MVIFQATNFLKALLTIVILSAKQFFKDNGNRHFFFKKEYNWIAANIIMNS